MGPDGLELADPRSRVVPAVGEGGARAASRDGDSIALRGVLRQLEQAAVPLDGRPRRLEGRAMDVDPPRHVIQPATGRVAIALAVTATSSSPAQRRLVSSTPSRMARD
ncbi:MAG TPA: hypothetical protein VF494_12185 [Candidatus Limnocylindrales bacterium]